MNSLPYFSIIIPQKNRAEYLYHTIRTCMIQDYENLEILVSDDCSEDNSVAVVRSLMKIDSRIKLFAHDHHLGMRDNFEFVLNQVKPGYVMALGGDDGLVPGAVNKMLKILNQTGAQLLTWTPDLFYYAEEPNGKNIICVKRHKDYYVKMLESKSYLKKIAETFNYMTDDCPMFYVKGVASTEIVDRVKSRTADGCFYSCPTPDGFSGVVLAGEVKEYAFTNEPLSIIGSSPKSQGKNYHRTDEESQKEAKEFFKDNEKRPMHQELASQQYSPLVTLMTADYLLRAHDLPGWSGYYVPLSYEKLIYRTFEFLKNSTFQSSVLVRELKILKEVAIQHNLLDLFNKLLQGTKRKVVWEKNVYGFAITNSIRLEGRELGINDIFDAAMASHYISLSYKKLSIKGLVEALSNSIRIVARQYKFKKEKLPMV